MAEEVKDEVKEVVSKNFIEMIIEKDLAEGVYDHVMTRFPPEPNGYLHIGHAKSILLNYGLAQQYGGKFNLRFDDTNPTKEKTEFVQSIKADVEWLGADFEDRLFYASNYFDKMHEAAIELIKKGKAFVCDLSAEEIREYRGTLTEPGKNSPYRDRSVEENLKLFEEMTAGKYEDGSKVLRAKIDMSSPNINMRDPVIYRVARMTHQVAQYTKNKGLAFEALKKLILQLAHNAGEDGFKRVDAFEALEQTLPSGKTNKAKQDYLGRILSKMAENGLLRIEGRKWYITGEGEKEIRA